MSLVAALAAVALLWAGGDLVRPRSMTPGLAFVPQVGRTSTVCSMGAADFGGSTSISTVVIRTAPSRSGTLTAAAVGRRTTVATVTEQGKGRQLSGQGAPVVLAGEGAMATSSSGMVFGVATSGVQRGLMAAPCTAPTTQHWFVGVGADSDNRTELLLTNPDEAQAQVDLDFFGPGGALVVPGSPGVVVPAHATRTVPLESLTTAAGPLTVSVRATVGRVSAVARDVATMALEPGGADWHTSSAAPANRLVVPDVPEGEGGRQLLVANPGTTAATVNIQLLGQLGAFAPSGAETLQVAPRSTASVNLAAGLVGAAAGVRVSSVQPVTAAVRSTSQRRAAHSDFAVQPASAPLVRTGVVALATLQGTDSELVLSNGGR